MAASSVSSYYAPTYFPPSFFYASVSAATTTVGMPYNAPSYFPASYFYGNIVSNSPPPTPTPTPTPPTPIVTPGRDQEAYAALLALIQGLGVFEEVIYGAAIQRNQAGVDCYPLALLTPKGWEESDDYDPTFVVRRAKFGITIVVQTQDGEPQFDQLDRLSSVVIGVVDFAGLGSQNLPALTRIRTGSYESSTHYPEQSVELEGEFASLVNSSALVPALP